MKVILVDPSSSDTRWRFKSSLRDASKGIESRMKKCNPTASSEVGPSYPLVFRNSHIRKNLSRCGLALEETSDSEANMCPKVQHNLETPPHPDLQRKLIFKDEFGQEYVRTVHRKRSKRGTNFKIHKNAFVPSKGELTFCGSQQRTLRPSDLAKSDLTVIDFRCSTNESKAKLLNPKGVSLLGINELQPGKKAGGVYDKMTSGLNFRDSVKGPYKVQSFRPSESFNSGWKLKRHKKGVRSDTSSLTCTFRVAKKDGFTKTER